MNIIIGVVIGVCITKIYINIKNYLEFKRLFKQANELLKIIDEQVECIRLDHLNDDQKKAYRLVHNKLTMNSDFELSLLESELEAIEMDLQKFGFVFDEEIACEEEIEKPEIEFTSSLDEEHNYVVLYFDNDIDWLQAQSVFDIKTKKELSTRKDGTIKNERKGIGRVLNGAEILSKLMESAF